MSYWQALPPELSSYGAQRDYDITLAKVWLGRSEGAPRCMRHISSSHVPV